MICLDRHWEEVCQVGASQRDVLVVRLYKFQYSSCVRKPWKMMDRPRDYVTKKGMLEPGG
jgi:hypothetical protein